jgi:ribosomal protein S18 acetylase RimI-like enzyme
VIRKIDIERDLDVVVGLIYDTDAYLFPFLFGRRESALPVIRELVLRNDNSFSHKYIWCEAKAEAVRGILIGYDHRTIDSEAESADFRAVLNWFDQALLFFKYLILKPFMDKSDVTGFYIQNVCVAPEYRGQGIGSALIQHFCNLHAGEVFLDVEMGNKNARIIYERLGFRVVAEKRILLPGLGSLRMAKGP